MRYILLFFVILLSLSTNGEVVPQKQIYLPKPASAHDTSGDDEDIEFGWDASKWDKSRMISTDNIVLFWAPGFGDNLAKAPDYMEIKENGDTVMHNMKVDLPNLLSKLESFYGFFRDSLQFTKPGSKADQYKMMVMLDYSLEGTAFGGDYDSEIGALWLAPNRIQDENLNCIAHELGHSFQSQITCDGEGEAWGGNGFFEMTSQWMLWQVNPEWQKDERFHLDAFSDLTHKAFLHLDNIYHSPYIIELWGEKHGKPFIAELFRQGKKGEDPAMTYMRVNNMSQEEFNDEMFQNYRKLMNWDIDRVRDYTRGYTDIWHTDLKNEGNGRLEVTPENAPENYGFNAIPLTPPQPGKKLTVDFRGEAGKNGFKNINTENAGWRYGFVWTDNNDDAHYGDIYSNKKGNIKFECPKNKEVKKLWLVVMGAPTKHWSNVDWPEQGEDAQWPYSIKVVY